MKHPESIQKSRKAASKKRCTAHTSSGPRFCSASNAMHTASAICKPAEVETMTQVMTVLTAQAREEARVQEHLHNVQSTRERIRQAIADAVHVNFNAPAIHATAPLDDNTVPLTLVPLVPATTAPTSLAPGTRTTSPQRAHAARRSLVRPGVSASRRRASRQSCAEKSQTSVMSNANFVGFLSCIYAQH